VTSSQIKCFLVAAKYLNFTKAAKEVFLSQPGLSRQITTLENELGVPLFERRPNSVALTPAGELCVQYFTKWRNDLIQLRTDLDQLSSNQKKLLIIGVLEDQMVGKCYEDVFSWFRINRPDVEIRLSYYPASQMAAALTNHDIDLAVVPEREVENVQNIAYKRSRKDRCRLVVPASHPKANSENPSLLDFQDLAFLVLENDDSEAVSLQHKMILRIENYNPPAVYSVPSFGTLSMLLQSGAGISVLSKWHYLSNAPFLKFLEVPEIGYRLEAVAWRKGETNPIVREFVDKVVFLDESKTKAQS